ncbi:MAG TPA: hypothetical protein PKW95_04470 [bacterium]|nr:hypothetical protein [bacterium]
MAQVKQLIVQQAGLTAALLLLLPGLRYFMPTGDLFYCKITIVLAVVWLLLAILSAYLKTDTKFIKAVRYLTAAATAVFLAFPFLYLNLILFTFFRWVWTVTLVVLLALFGVVLRFSRQRLVPLLIEAFLLMLVGMVCFWWNFTMMNGGAFDPQTAPSGVKAMFSVAELQRAGTIGEAHPYAMAYDEQNDVLIASFKDDWGAVFGRNDNKRRNFLALRKTEDLAAEPSFLFFGSSQQPENLALHPEEKIGWVNVLDVGKRTFHIGAFSYADNRLSMIRMEQLPEEPNAVFYDDARKRLLVVGIEMELLELDSETLQVRTIRRMTSDMEPQVKGLGAIWRQEFIILMAMFESRSNQLFIATLGQYTHALSLNDFHDRRADTYPLVVCLAFDPVRGKIAATQPIQKRIAIIDVATMKVEKTIDTGYAVRPIAFLKQGEWLLTGGYTGNGTMIFDRHSGRMIRRFALGRLQRNAIATSDGERAFIATGWGVFSVEVNTVR